jgi:hypothetical protein
MKDNPETVCLSHQISEERCERNMNKEDALFIAVAWIVKPAFRLFKLCPEVVWLDVTSHSNNKGFHLLYFTNGVRRAVTWSLTFFRDLFDDRPGRYCLADHSDPKAPIHFLLIREIA